MKKKIIALGALVLIIVVAVVSVSLLNGENEEYDLNIVSTTFPGYDFARAVVEDNENANVEMLLSPGAESHTYEPSPADIIAIENSDVFIYVGGESDSWVDEILKDIDNEDLVVIKLVDIIDLKEEEIVEGMESEHEEEEEVEYDEHVWTSPENAIIITEYIKEKIIDIDSENESIYEESASEYVSELELIDAEIEKIVSESTYNTLVFGDRFPFRYLVDEYSLDYYAAFPGCSSETEASASTIAFLIDMINELGISVVLKMELTSSDIADTIASETGAEVLTLNAGHNITQEEFDAGVTMADLMWSNAEVLKEALN